METGAVQGAIGTVAVNRHCPDVMSGRIKNSILDVLRRLYYNMERKL